MTTQPTDNAPVHDPMQAFLVSELRLLVDTQRARLANLAAEVARLRVERNFLLDRANAAWSISFSDDRWTGMSSNALVTIAFGGEDNSLPSDSSDLAACYRTVMRLPDHLVTQDVLKQLKRGEDEVCKRYPANAAITRTGFDWSIPRHDLATADQRGPVLDAWGVE